jgi:ribonuclease P protein component
MKREYSLARKKIIDLVFRAHDSKGSSNFVVYKLKTLDDHFTFLISIGKKYGNSVQRNLMKRRIRAIVDEISTLIDNYSIVIVVKPTSNVLSYLNIKNEIVSLLKRSKVIKET